MVKGRLCVSKEEIDYFDVDKYILKVKRLSKKNSSIVYYELAYSAFLNHMIIIEAVGEDRSWFWIFFPSARLMIVLDDKERRGLLRGTIALSAQQIYSVRYDQVEGYYKSIYDELLYREGMSY